MNNDVHNLISTLRKACSLALEALMLQPQIAAWTPEQAAMRVLAKRILRRALAEAENVKFGIGSRQEGNDEHRENQD